MVKPAHSDACERVRVQLLDNKPFDRDDVAELVEDYDALADTYERIMTGKPPKQGEH